MPFPLFNTATGSVRNLLVASSNGFFYREDLNKDLLAMSTSVTLASAHPLQSTDLFQKLYIADWDDVKITDTDGVISSSPVDNSLSDTSGVDWHRYSIDINTDVVVITNPTGGTVAGNYKISSINTGSLTLATAPGNGGCTYRVERAPKVYDPFLDTLEIMTATEGKGQVPTGNPLIATWRGRLMLAGAVQTPHVWYGSRQGDPLDFDYGQSDVQRAIAGTPSEFGTIRGSLTAMIPHSDDYLMLATKTSLYVMRGDPAFGGQVDLVSDDIGIVARNAWCKTPEGFIVFLSRDAVYAVPPGGQVAPQAISQSKFAAGLQDLDTNKFTVSMGYDVRGRGIHLFFTENATGGTSGFWMDWEGKSFWPTLIPAAQDPFVIHFHDDSVTQTESNMYLGCRDGYIRNFSTAEATDDGTDIDSHVLYGPFLIGEDGAHEGILLELIAVLASTGGDLKWSVFIDETAETVVDEATAFDTGTWSANLNATIRPRATGAGLILKLENPTWGQQDTRTTWAVEMITMITKSAGIQRVG